MDYTQLASSMWFLGRRAIEGKEKTKKTKKHVIRIQALRKLSGRTGQEMLTPRKLSKETEFRSLGKEAGMGRGSRLGLS